MLVFRAGVMIAARFVGMDGPWCSVCSRYDITRFFDKQRIARELEWVAAMGLRTKRLPDSVYRREREPGRLGHGTRAPMRRIGWHDLASVAEKRGERGASFLRPQRGGK
jgi:hypothetical protein